MTENQGQADGAKGVEGQNAAEGPHVHSADRSTTDQGRAGGMRASGVTISTKAHGGAEGRRSQGRLNWLTCQWARREPTEAELKNWMALAEEEGEECWATKQMMTKTWTWAGNSREGDDWTEPVRKVQKIFPHPAQTNPLRPQIFDMHHVSGSVCLHRDHMICNN